MSASERDPFFVGYLPVPGGLRVFLTAVAFFLFGGFVASALLIGGTQDDPGDAAFRYDWGRQTLTGVLDASPYPVLHVTRGTKRIPAGRTVLLSGNGKRGVQTRAAPLDGQHVEISGVALKRGDIDMVQLRNGRNGLKKADGAAQPASVEKLGRWRLSGEICDGKCLSGAMRPGRGLSHRACANFCLIGGIPPVFVSSAPVDGREFFLMASRDGKTLGPDLLNHVAQYISVEGAIEKRGNIHVFMIDPSSVKMLP
ncbi:MAG: hypothetical protein ACR2O4_12275 [Hyphomicrobiaceae bacterium]